MSFVGSTYLVNDKRRKTADINSNKLRFHMPMWVLSVAKYKKNIEINFSQHIGPTNTFFWCISLISFVLKLDPYLKSWLGLFIRQVLTVYILVFKTIIFDTWNMCGDIAGYAWWPNISTAFLYCHSRLSSSLVKNSWIGDRICYLLIFTNRLKAS